MIHFLLPVAIQAAVVPTVPPASSDWRAMPVAAGGWTYRRQAGGSEAQFGPAGAPRLVLRCDLVSRTLTMSVTGAAPATPLTLSTTNGDAVSTDGRFAARDPILDAMAFSRGRFAVTVNGGFPLVVPSWPEAARSVEDCRN